MKLTILPSDKGDCLFLEPSDGTAILIDGGMKDSFVEHVRPFLAEWQAGQQKTIDLVYVSHIDQDHIQGILRLMDDIVDWRVFDHKTAIGEPWDEPDFARPPGVAGIWHNGFHDLIGENSGSIGSMLAARASELSFSANPAVQTIAAAFQRVASSIPESIKLSARVSPAQLQIPLNNEFGNLLALVSEPPDEVQLGGANSAKIRVIGPFEDDLEELRDEWNDWLRNKKNKNNLKNTRKWRDEENERLDFAAGIGLDIDDEIGDRAKVTIANLASLMLSVEDQGKRLILTGDGHSIEVLDGMDHHGLLNANGNAHVAIMKIPHHGSEFNLDRDFVQRVTADHYVICGNGMHENPDLRILDVLVNSRIGTVEERSDNPETGNEFHVWFNCSTDFLERQIEHKKAQGRGVKKLGEALEHFEHVEALMDAFKCNSGGKLKLHFLDDEPLVLEV